MAKKYGKCLVSGCSKKDLVWVVGVLDSEGNSDFIYTPYEGKVEVYPMSVSEFTGYIDQDETMVFTGSIIECEELLTSLGITDGVVFKSGYGEYRVRYLEDSCSLETILNCGGTVSGNLFNKSGEYKKRYKEIFGSFSLDEFLSDNEKVKRLLYSIFHEGSDN
jgi:hypothetical protein